MGVISCTNTAVQLNNLDVPMEDFAGEDTAIEFPDAIAKFMVEEGADGGAVYYKTGKRGGDVTFRFLPTSMFCQLLWDLWVIIDSTEDPNNDESIIMSGNIVNNDTGASCAMHNGIIREAPPFYSMERDKVSAPAFTFFFAQLIPDFSNFRTRSLRFNPDRS